MPKQSGTADSCQTLAEEELFTYLDSLDLITVGWIHVSISNLVIEWDKMAIVNRPG